MTDLDVRGGIKISHLDARGKGLMAIRNRALSDHCGRTNVIGHENLRRLLVSPALKVVGITMAPFGQLDPSASKTFHPELSVSHVPHSAFPARLWKSIRGMFR